MTDEIHNHNILLPQRIGRLSCSALPKRFLWLFPEGNWDDVAEDLSEKDHLRSRRSFFVHLHALVLMNMTKPRIRLPGMFGFEELRDVFLHLRENPLNSIRIKFIKSDTE